MSGNRKRFTLVAQILLDVQYRSSSIGRSPAAAMIAITRWDASAPMVRNFRKLLSTLNPMATAEISQKESARGSCGASQQLNQANIQRSGNALHVVNGYIALASLYGSDVGPVQSADLRQFLLRKTTLCPKLTSIGPEDEPVAKPPFFAHGERIAA